MLDKLLEIDTQLLLAINQWHAPWADTVMWIISQKSTWFALYGLLIALLISRYPKPASVPRWQWMHKVPVWLVIVLTMVLAIGASDFIASGILKDWVARPRPSRVPELQGILHLVNDYRSGQYGFVSSHASTTMACATLFSLIWRNKIATGLLMLWVAMNCYSRMYLGVHYPLDILGGLLVGIIVSWAAYAWLNWMQVLRLAEEPTNCKSFEANGAPGYDVDS